MSSRRTGPPPPVTPWTTGQLPSQDVSLAVLARVAYAGHAHGDGIPGPNSAARLTRALADPNVVRFAGPGWTVASSTQDAAVFVNYATNRIVIAPRGSHMGLSKAATRDWLGNNIPGLAVGRMPSVPSNSLAQAIQGDGSFGIPRDPLAPAEPLLMRRANTTWETVGKAALALHQETGFEIEITGHSLAGSVGGAQVPRLVEAGVDINNITLVTIDTPDRMAQNGSEDLGVLGDLAAAGRFRAYYVDGDPANALPFDGRGEARIRLDNPNDAPPIERSWGAALLDAAANPPIFRAIRGIISSVIRSGEAHRLGTAERIFTGGEWDGVFDPSTMDPNVPTPEAPPQYHHGHDDDAGAGVGSGDDLDDLVGDGAADLDDLVGTDLADEIVFVQSGPDGEMEVWLNPPGSGLEAARHGGGGPDLQVTEESDARRDGLFFSVLSTELILRNADGEELSRIKVAEERVLNAETQAALGAMKIAAISASVDLISDPGNFRIAVALRSTAEAGATAYMGKVVAGQLQPLVGSEMVADTLGNGAVNAAYQAILGDHAAAMQTAFNTAAAAALQQLSGLPMSAGRLHMYASGGLPGSSGTTAIRRDHVSMAVGPMQAGAHYDRFTQVWTNRAGQTVVREGHEVGGHLSAFGIDNSIGLRSGFEASSALDRIRDDGVTERTWYDRRFENELTLSFGFGKRRGSWRILPAWRSHKRTYVYEFREDGSDLLPATTGLANEILPWTGGRDEAAGAAIAHHRADNGTGDLDVNGGGGGDDDEAVRTHDRRSDSLLGGMVRDEGRDEHVTSRLTTHHKKKRWFKKTKRWTDTDTYGWAEEVGKEVSTTSTEAATAGGDPGELLVTTVAQDSVVSSFHDRNGSRKSEEVTQTGKRTVKLSSRADGGLIDPDGSPERAWTGVGADGTTQVEHTERDLARLEDEQVYHDQDGRLRTSATVESHVGTVVHQETGSVNVTHARGSHETVQTFKVRVGEYVDERKATTITSPEVAKAQADAAAVAAYDAGMEAEKARAAEFGREMDALKKQNKKEWKRTHKDLERAERKAAQDRKNELQRQRDQVLNGDAANENVVEITKHAAGEARREAGVEAQTVISYSGKTLREGGLFTEVETKQVTTERTYTDGVPAPGGTDNDAGGVAPGSTDGTDGNGPSEAPEGRVYSETPTKVTEVVSVTKPAAGAAGWFVDETIETKTVTAIPEPATTSTADPGGVDGAGGVGPSDGEPTVERTMVESRRLNAGAERAMGVAVTGSLDRALQIIKLHNQGKCSTKRVAEAISTLGVDIGEGYLVGLAGQLAAVTKELGDAVPYALVTIFAAHVARFAIGRACSDDQDEIGLAIAKREQLGKKESSRRVIDISADVARAGLQLAIVGYELTNSTPMMFGATACVTAFHKMAVAINDEGLSLRVVSNAVVELVPELAIAAAGTAASVLAGKLLVASSVFASGALTTSVATVVLPALAFWGTCKILKWGWNKYAGTPEERELASLLTKHGIDAGATDADVKRRWKKLVRKMHPDKGGSTEAFQEFNRDFERIFELLAAAAEEVAIKEAREGQNMSRREAREAAAASPWVSFLRTCHGLVRRWRGVGAEGADIDADLKRLEGMEKKMERTAALSAELHEKTE